MKKYYARKRKSRRKTKTWFCAIICLPIAALVAGIFLIVSALGNQPGNQVPPNSIVDMTAPDGSAVLPSANAEPELTPEPTLADNLTLAAIEDTTPSKFGFETHIYADDAEQESFERSVSVFFPAGAEYTALKGVTTYRGNNYRDASGYGIADITDEKLSLLDIDKTTDAIDKWRGSACTGQPLIVTWPDETRKNMTSLYEEFRNREGFTEVIIASADGNIYFMELSSGKKTRHPINIGSPTKGTPSLDPRGYPIIYVGQGLNPAGSIKESNDMYFRIYSLIDGKLLYSFGWETKDPTAYRKNWQAYDSSPLIDAATDMLIEPGENGVLYTVKLNTVYDAAAGTVTMNPDPIVKYTYTSTRNEQTKIYGMENSAVAWRNYIFITDNIGMLQCIDLNTMKLIYANDLENDSDVSMVLEEDIENQGFYLYTGCEYDDTVLNAEDSTGTCYARKIDGLTGKIIWSEPFTIFTEIGGDVDGGILASPILGKEGTTMEGLIIYTVSSVIKDDGSKTALVVALDKETGKIVWQVDMENSGWTPSSPAAVYTQDGQGYIIQCLYKGTIKLIRADKDTASVVDSINVSEEFGSEESNSFEATPVVFENMIVVGSRSGHFFFLNIM